MDCTSRRWYYPSRPCFVAYYKYTEIAKKASRILFSSIVKNSDFKQANIFPEVVPWHTETLPIRVSGFHLAGTKHLL